MTARIRFGISLPNRAVLFGVAPGALLETAERAEASGFFDSVWVGDNLLSKPRLESIVTLSALAARTRRLKLGEVCLASFPLRHPLLLAIQWASLDLLSGGRTILTVCIGGSDAMGPAYANELAAMGVRSNERVPRLEEGVQLLRAFWGPEPVTHHGRFYTFTGVQALPKPLQARVPIIIASNPAEDGDPAIEERVLRRIARLADGWQTDGTPPGVFRERWQRIREYAVEAGRADQVIDASLHLMVNLDDHSRRARRVSVEFLDHYYGVGAISERMLGQWLAAGPPAAVVEKVLTYLDAGCTTPILRFTSPDQRGQLDRFLEDVAPTLAGLTGQGGRPTAAAKLPRSGWTEGA
jgi:alkanesulfonate monooxygenase SsuD/methylene tetrahydromethanopterin reductase-like flavin-dependent oxidoreductase (luciferase family)